MRLQRSTRRSALPILLILTLSMLPISPAVAISPALAQDFAATGCAGFVLVDNFGVWSGEQYLTGWAVDLNATGITPGVDLIEVYLGEWPVAWDSVGYPRTDADEYAGRPDLRAGFEIWINFDSLPAGNQTFSVWARTECERVEAQVILAVAPSTPPVVAPPPPPPAFVSPPPPPAAPTVALSISDDRRSVGSSYSSGYSTSGYGYGSTCVSRDQYGNCLSYGGGSSGIGSTCVSRDQYGNCISYGGGSSGIGSTCISRDQYGNCLSYDSGGIYGGSCVSRDIYGNCSSSGSGYYGGTTSGEVNFNFNVTLSGTSSQTVSVYYATADGTAIQGTDYTATNGTLSFSPGEMSKAITVRVYDRGYYSGERNFYVNLSSPVNASIADSQGLGTLVGSSSTSGFYGGGGGYYGGGYGGIGNCGFGLIWNGFACVATGSGTTSGTSVVVNATGTVTLTWSTVTGASGYQVFVGSGSVCNNFSTLGSPLAATTTTTTISLTGTYCIQVRDTLSGTPVFVTATTGTGVGGSISINDATCTAGADCNFTVTQTGGTTTATVTYQTVNGTASGLGACPTIPITAHDFIAVSSGSVSVGAGGSGNVAITTCANEGTEGSENFSVSLISTTAGTIVGATGAGTITTGAAGPTPTPTPPAVGSISISDAACTSGSPCAFTVTQTGGTAAATVTYSTFNGTALGVAACPGAASLTADYVTVTGGSVTVAAGGTNTIAITTCANVPGEPSQVFGVDLTGTTSGSILDGQGIGTIAETAGGGSISIVDAICLATLPCNFTVSRSGGIGPVNVNYTTTDGPAPVATGVASCPGSPSATADYVTVSGIVSVPAGGSGTANIAISTCATFPPEVIENFTVTLSSPTGGASLADGTATGSISP